jgi:hypothetical protein
MRLLGIPEEYIHMTQVLFKEATVAVCMNGKESASFPIHRGVR